MRPRPVGQQFDLPAMRGDVFMDDGQPDATAAGLVDRLALAPVEGFEDAGTVGGRDTRAAVDDVDAGPAGFPGDRKLDGTARGAETDRVRQQVSKGHSHLVPVDLGPERVTVDPHPQQLGLPLQALLVDEVADEGHQFGAPRH